jgi:hypothetical protein
MKEIKEGKKETDIKYRKMDEQRKERRTNK